jgi:hypothetical protein
VKVSERLRFLFKLSERVRALLMVSAPFLMVAMAVAIQKSLGFRVPNWVIGAAIGIMVGVLFFTGLRGR